MLPDQSGTYILILRLPQARTLTIGKLGRFPFPQGWYAYVGSAHGSGGLAARVERHLRTAKRHHWHVDYLRAVAPPSEVWYVADRRRLECRWAEQLATRSNSTTPARGFGASDCRCPTHLFHLPTPPDYAAFADLITPTPTRHEVSPAE
jgi:Uri superfamily endonuclease